jgi:hypothetical protein
VSSPSPMFFIRPIVKKLLSLNSSVMDDNYDTYKTANIEINHMSLTALHRGSSHISTFAPVKSFIHVSEHFLE